MLKPHNQMVDALCRHLHAHIEIADQGRFLELVAQCPDLNRLNTNGISPLAMAVSYGYPCFVRQLLERGADPNIDEKHPPLFRLRWDRLRILNMLPMLIEYGVNVNKKDHRGWYPWEWGCDDLTRALVDAGADFVRCDCRLTREFRCVANTMLSFAGLPRGMAWRVIEWMLQC